MRVGWRKARAIGLSAAILFGFSTAAAAQASRTKVEVSGLGEWDLKQTARRHNVSTSRISNARTILESVTETLIDSDPLQSAGVVNQVGWLWPQLHRRQASEALNRLLQVLSKSAVSSDRPKAFVSSTHMALQIATSLSSVDPDRALQRIVSWPSPPAEAGESAHALSDQIRTAAQDPEWLSHFQADPSGALRSLTSTGFERRMLHLDAPISGEKRKRLADELADDLVSEYSQGVWDRNRVQEFLGRMLRVSQRETSMLPELLFLLSDALEQVGIHQEAPRYIIATNSGEAEISELESIILANLRSLIYSRPGAMISWLDSMPDLRAKLDQIGGIDQGLQRSRIRELGSKPVEGTAEEVSEDDSYKKAASLGRDALTKPLAVRMELARIAGMEEGFLRLRQLFQASQHQYPELAWEALKAAEPLLTEPDSLFEQAHRHTAYARIYRASEGRLSDGLLKSGFSLLGRLRDVEDEDASARQQGGPSGRGKGHADNLELALIAELALVDFDNALRRIRRIEEQPRRIQAMLNSIQSLIQR